MKYLIAFLLTTSIVTASDDIYCYKNTETCPSGSIIIAYEFRTVGLHCDFDKQMVTMPNESSSRGASFGGGVMCVKRHKPRERKYFKK
jgi:hypothetical protein